MILRCSDSDTHSYGVYACLSCLRSNASFTAAEASAQQAEHPEVAPGSALLVIQRISYTSREEPIYVQERYYRPDRVQYRFMLRRHNDEAEGSKMDEFHAVLQSKDQR